MADRLQELLQQRALIREHLAWLEGEIAAASGKSATPENTAWPAPAPVSPAAATSAPASVSSAPAFHPRHSPSKEDPDAMIARLAAAEKTTPVPTKKGCWIVFVSGLIFFGVAAWVLLRFFYRD
jgi:hypothetical protein